MKVTKLIWFSGIIGGLGASSLFVKDVFSTGQKYDKGKLSPDFPVIGGQYSWTLSEQREGTGGETKYEITGLRYHGPTGSKPDRELWLSGNGLKSLKEIWAGEQCSNIDKKDSKKIEKTLIVAITTGDGENECSKKLNKKLSSGVKNKNWAWYYR